jgi:hypothetical protein
MLALDVKLADLVRLKLVPSMFPTLDLHLGTIYRWSQTGLRTVVVGGVRMTSEKWVREFIERKTAARDGERAPIQPTNPPGRPLGRRRLKEVHRDLDKLLGPKSESPDVGDERPASGRRRTLPARV